MCGLGKGCGQLLWQVLRLLGTTDVEIIHGVDIDVVSVQLARLALFANLCVHSELRVEQYRSTNDTLARNLCHGNGIYVPFT